MVEVAHTPRGSFKVCQTTLISLPTLFELGHAAAGKQCFPDSHQKELLHSSAGVPKDSLCIMAVTLASRPNTLSYEPCLEGRLPLGPCAV